MSRAVMCWDPKYPHNLGNIVRMCACFGVTELHVYGHRVALKAEEYKGFRLPREERMRDYKSVQIIQLGDKPFDEVRERRPELTPVAVEITPSSELLHSFMHPENPMYVFGPEDGSLPKVALMHCHRHVKIPMYHCANLANAVSMVLYDEDAKATLAGDRRPKATGQDLGDWLATGHYAR